MKQAADDADQRVAETVALAVARKAEVGRRKAEVGRRQPFDEAGGSAVHMECLAH